jgi:hypothetical protein
MIHGRFSHALGVSASLRFLPTDEDPISARTRRLNTGREACADEWHGVNETMTQTMRTPSAPCWPACSRWLLDQWKGPSRATVWPH